MGYLMISGIAQEKKIFDLVLLIIRLKKISD